MTASDATPPVPPGEAPAGTPPATVAASAFKDRKVADLARAIDEKGRRAAVTLFGPFPGEPA